MTVRNAAVPAALRPKPPAPASEQPVVPRVAAAAPPLEEPGAVLHLAIVVPDERIRRLIADRCYVIGPTTQPRLRATVHVVLEDKDHQAQGLGPFMRWALVETGLVPPEDVGLVTSAQVELGWANHEGRP